MKLKTLLCIAGLMASGVLGMARADDLPVSVINPPSTITGTPVPSQEAAPSVPSINALDQRITDIRIANDNQSIDLMQNRAAKLNSRGVPATSYHMAKAQAYIEYANCEYAQNERCGAVEDALKQAHGLLTGLEAGQQNLPLETPVGACGQRIRPDMWSKVEEYKADERGLRCAGAEIARLEVKLVQAGHDYNELGWRNAMGSVREAERLMADVEEALKKCPKQGTIWVDCPPQFIVGNECKIPTLCPPQYVVNGQCQLPAECPPQFLRNGVCDIPPLCPVQFMRNGVCELPTECPAQYVVNGQCQLPPQCPPQYMVNGQCMMPPECPPQFQVNGQCMLPPLCPPELIENGQCKLPLPCPPPPPPVVACPPEFIIDGQCLGKQAATALREMPKLVHFERDKYDITHEAKIILDRAAAVLIENPDISITLDAYTDRRGSVKYNQQLATKRAQNIFNYLMSKGISAERLKPVVHGESGAVAQECTPQAHAFNRRVEFGLVYHDPNRGNIVLKRVIDVNDVKVDPKQPADCDAEYLKDYKG